MEGSIRKRAGAVGDAEVRERVGEPEGAHEAHRRGRRERNQAAEQGDPPPNPRRRHGSASNVGVSGISAAA